ncbi:hypothetical protein J4458_04405 [Candidatus Woesearchaeota archaeon]|nr:hypothetical protein [Candidatus Woesearchaeota archaeon]
MATVEKMSGKRPPELKWICSLIIITKIPSLLIASVLLIELILANKIFSQLNATLIGLIVIFESIVFIVLAVALLQFKSWAYKLIIPISLLFLIIIIPYKSIINVINNTFNFNVIQNIVVPLVLYIWAISYFRKNKIKRLYLKKQKSNLSSKR